MGFDCSRLEAEMALMHQDLVLVYSVMQQLRHLLKEDVTQ